MFTNVTYGDFTGHREKKIRTPHQFSIVCPNGRDQKTQIMFIFQSLILGLEIALHSEEEAGKSCPVFTEKGRGALGMRSSWICAGEDSETIER